MNKKSFGSSAPLRGQFMNETNLFISLFYSSGGEKESSPSPTRQRPTLSSAFKQSRRGSSGEHSGPSSLRSNSGVGLTEEEAEMLAAIKTEKLKDDADASKGFVISFDSDTPKKPKPQLKTRR